MYIQYVHVHCTDTHIKDGIPVFNCAYMIHGKDNYMKMVEVKRLLVIPN